MKLNNFINYEIFLIILTITSCRKIQASINEIDINSLHFSLYDAQRKNLYKSIWSNSISLPYLQVGICKCLYKFSRNVFTMSAHRVNYWLRLRGWPRQGPGRLQWRHTEQTRDLRHGRHVTCDVMSRSEEIIAHIVTFELTRVIKIRDQFRVDKIKIRFHFCPILQTQPSDWLCLLKVVM